jgi:CRP-like cAMP-binding protein
LRLACYNDDVVEEKMGDDTQEPAKLSDRQSLAEITLLAGLSEEQRAELAVACAWRRYRDGERLFEYDSAGDDVFFIVEGAVRISSPSISGREVGLAKVGAGETIGEMAAIDGLARSASVSAVGDALVAVLPAKHFVALLEQNGAIAVGLLRRMSSMLRHTGARVVELSSIGATKRVYAELLRLAKPDSVSSDLWTVDPLPPLRDLAASAGTTRELVNKALNSLYPEGLIRRRGKTLYLLDKLALEEAAQESKDQL